MWIQNQTGPHPTKWNKTGVVVEVKQHDQYLVRVDGSNRLTLRNRKFLRKYTPLHPRRPPARMVPLVQPSFTSPSLVTHQPTHESQRAPESQSAQEMEPAQDLRPPPELQPAGETQPLQETSAPTPIRRSTRTRRKPDFYVASSVCY